jgi:hypothetical protein
MLIECVDSLIGLGLVCLGTARCCANGVCVTCCELRLAAVGGVTGLLGLLAGRALLGPNDRRFLILKESSWIWESLLLYRCASGETFSLRLALWEPDGFDARLLRGPMEFFD